MVTECISVLIGISTFEIPLVEVEAASATYQERVIEYTSTDRLCLSSNLGIVK